MITLHGISLSFGNKNIITDFSCHINKHEKVVIQGQSGSGKSSIIKSIMGLVSYTGTIHINNTLLNSDTIRELRSHIFYAHQNIHFHEGTVRETIEYIGSFAANNADLEPQKINEMLETCNLAPDILDQPIESVSGGEKQRIGIGIGILLEKPIWILDEPLSGLDINNKYHIMHILEHITATMLIVSHDTEWNNDFFTKITI
ncbi:MAG: ABC transporter ATP-binding protein [Bacteroidales bacterium]